MDNEFAVLAQFLGSLGPEVSGRSSSPLNEEQMATIQQFVEGKLGAAERESFVSGIIDNDTAIHELVQKIKAIG